MRRQCLVIGSKEARNRSVRQYFLFTGFGQKIAQQAHLHPWLHEFVVMIRFPAGRFASLGARDIAVGRHTFLSALAFHQLLLQSYAAAVPRGSPLTSLSYHFGLMLRFCAVPCHTNSLLPWLLSTA